MLSFLKIKIVKIGTSENKIEHFGLVVEFRMGMFVFSWEIWVDIFVWL